LEKAECRCIFEIIHSGGDTGDHIVGWLFSKNLPQWVGNYSDWLMSNKDPTKKQFGEEDSLQPNAKCGGSNSDMTSVIYADEVPVQKTTNTSIKSFRKNSSDSEVSAHEESRCGKSEESNGTSSDEDRKSRQCAGKQNSKYFSQKKAKSHDHTDIKNESGSKLEHGKTPTNVHIGNKSDEEIMKGNNQENYNLSPSPDDPMVDIFNNDFAKSVCDNTKELPKLPKLLTSLCQVCYEIGGLDLCTSLLFMVIRKHGF
jgi:hypothetical protein